VGVLSLCTLRCHAERKSRHSGISRESGIVHRVVDSCGDHAPRRNGGVLRSCAPETGAGGPGCLARGGRAVGRVDRCGGNRRRRTGCGFYESASRTNRQTLKCWLIDAKILIRAVLGVRVRTLIAKYGTVVELFAPDTAWAEARKHLPVILRKRGVPVEAALQLLSSLEEIIQPMEFETYGSFEQAARTRLGVGIPTIGLSWRRRSRFEPRSGPKTMIFSEQVPRPGRRIGSSCSWSKGVRRSGLRSAGESAADIGRLASWISRLQDITGNNPVTLPL